MFTSVQTLVTIDEELRSWIWTCFWIASWYNIPQGNCNFLSTKCVINLNWSSWSTDCAAQNSKPRVMLYDWRGDQPSKNWENLDFWSYSARTKCSQNAERPAAARGSAMSCTVCSVGERAKVRAHRYNWSIWCQGSSHTIGCVMAHLPVKTQLTEQNSMHKGKNLLVQSVFTR